MENKYQKIVEHIHTPEELSDRVVCAARRQETAKHAVSKRLTKQNFRPVLRGAVCAACALALVLGTVRFYPAKTQPETPVGQENTPTVIVPVFSFGLTAYASEIGEPITPNANGGLAFSSNVGMFNEEIGCYTGCLFQLSGADIQSVSISIDKGGLYRSETRTGLKEEELRELFRQEEQGELLLCDVDDGDGHQSAEVVTPLGSRFTEDYNPAVRYGFWTPEYVAGDSLSQSHEDCIDVFDGARLNVSVTYADGSEQSKTYLLSTGRLKTVHEKDGTITVLPQLAGDNESYVYGIYAASETESRWFQWPVQDCTTISLSNPFGERSLPIAEPNPENPEAGEEVRTVFHNGIDIPAPYGSVILAAADGTVAEIGFDTEQGNYLVLDHGNGLKTVYATCRDFTVEEGDTVKAGEMIGVVGTTGMSTGPHLCFQVWQDGEPQNPVAYFDSDIRDTLRMG